ncbi:UDP-glucuronate:xylan alpha-glucuronosyltransferase 2 isoform X2 [Magnolia sinica]|nr:UDP-glucuronate:xylan alpha-glucuronosyltransferase 2 isoform X2 [Magnolia sinica]
MKAVLETKLHEKRAILEKPSFIDEIIRNKTIGLVNMGDDYEIGGWDGVKKAVVVRFDRVSDLFKWKDLFPEWIDEEEDNDGPSCPEIPMPDFTMYEDMDVVVAQLPCRYPEEGWRRDVLRLQIHLIAANLAVKKGGRERMKVVFSSSCRPMVEIFRCDDLVKWDSDWWLYEPDIERLEQKLSMPVGSCKLALPLWGEAINEVYDLSKITMSKSPPKREAYVTVIHSSEAYVCGAITLAQSLIKTGTKRDLIILLDRSISQEKRQALIESGWKIREIERIRNPKAENNSYNEYNYSKFRLWQLVDYDRIIFIDSDIVVLRNLDILFNFPQMSATGNDDVIFNSGIMAIEPSNCTFQILMDQRDEVVSYNGGDQGFLNEVFVWWHRLPRRVNFLKNFWANTSAEMSMKNQLFGSDPPKLYTIHFLGLKPWHCYRDYDCNWDLSQQRVYASDVAHERWWKVHDAMNETLQRFCGLTPKRKVELDWDKKKAGEMGFLDEHWKLNISDPRRHT